MRKKQFLKKMVTYVCVAALTLAGTSGVAPMVSAEEEQPIEAASNLYKEVDVPALVREYDPGEGEGYGYIAGIDLTGVTKDYQYLQIKYTGDATAFDELRLEFQNGDAKLGVFWARENAEGTLKTVEDKELAAPSADEQTAIIDLAKSGIKNTDGITVMHFHGTKGKGKFEIKDAKFTNSDVEVKSVEAAPMVQKHDPGEGEGYKYLTGMDFTDVTNEYQYLQISYKGAATAFDELRLEIVGEDTNLGTFWAKENEQGTLKTVEDKELAAPSDEEQTAVIDLAKSGIKNTAGIKTIHFHDTAGKGAFEITDAQFTNTPLQVAKVHTDEPDASTTAPVVEPTTKTQPVDPATGIKLDGDDKGQSAMNGTYHIDITPADAKDEVTYKWLGYATFKDLATKDFKYLQFTYTGDISGMRLQFVANAGTSTEDKTDVIWFNPEQEKHFVTKDGTPIQMVGNNTTVTIDLEKSGVDMAKYNSGFHMHGESTKKAAFDVTIKDAVLYGGTPTAKPTTQPTTTKAITAGNTTVKSATKKKSAKKVKISLKKVKSAVGYRVQFSTTKKFKKVLVTKNIKKVKATITHKKLKNKKTLYVRAKAYIQIGKTKYYSAKWSKVKKVKIKK